MKRNITAPLTAAILLALAGSAQAATRTAHASRFVHRVTAVSPASVAAVHGVSSSVARAAPRFPVQARPGAG